MKIKLKPTSSSSTVVSVKMAARGMKSANVSVQKDLVEPVVTL